MTDPGGRGALISGLRRLASTPGGRRGEGGDPSGGTAERCDLCRTRLAAEHPHLLDVQERRILCVCETCVIRRSEDPRYRPPGRRTLRLPGFRLSDEVWARFHIPVGLAFFLFSAPARKVIALYPSPLGATESELDLAAWEDLVRENLMLASLDADTEALLVRRRSGGGAEPEYFVVPTDDCYRLVGLLKSAWKGLTGGAAAEEAIDEFFAGLRARARVA